MTDHVADMRQDYRQGALDEATCPAEPLALFEQWFGAARQCPEVSEANAMTLATVDTSGWPQARVVLLKAYDAGGFVFYTNYNSRKGRALDATMRAALVFWWPALESQVRVEGHVERVAPEVADAYFASRPRGSRLGAWASPQSEVIEDRSVLEGNLQDVTQKFEGQEVDRPEHWGGYRVVPERVEFWQGRTNRLHDRLVYHRLEGDGGWKVERLAP